MKRNELLAKLQTGIERGEQIPFGETESKFIELLYSMVYGNEKNQAHNAIVTLAQDNPFMYEDVKEIIGQEVINTIVNKKWS